jgi:hypothetical protein
MASCKKSTAPHGNLDQLSHTLVCQAVQHQISQARCLPLCCNTAIGSHPDKVLPPSCSLLLPSSTNQHLLHAPQVQATCVSSAETRVGSTCVRGLQWHGCEYGLDGVHKQTCYILNPSVIALSSATQGAVQIWALCAKAATISAADEPAPWQPLQLLTCVVATYHWCSVETVCPLHAFGVALN